MSNDKMLGVLFVALSLVIDVSKEKHKHTNQDEKRRIVLLVLKKSIDLFNDRSEEEKQLIIFELKNYIAQLSD